MKELLDGIPILHTIILSIKTLPFRATPLVINIDVR